MFRVHRKILTLVFPRPVWVGYSKWVVYSDAAELKAKKEAEVPRILVITVGGCYP